MPNTNAEIVRGAVEAYARGDTEAALAAYAEDVEFDVSSVRPEGGVYRGHEGTVAAILDWVGTWADYSWELEELVEAGDRVLMTIHESGRGVGSGAAIDQRIFWVLTLRAAKIAHVKLYLDRAEAAAAYEQ
jgi:ketosteroid isomerase-like protein